MVEWVVLVVLVVLMGSKRLAGVVEGVGAFVQNWIRLVLDLKMHGR